MLVVQGCPGKQQLSDNSLERLPWFGDNDGERWEALTFVQLLGLVQTEVEALAQLYAAQDLACKTYMQDTFKAFGVLGRGRQIPKDHWDTLNEKYPVGVKISQHQSLGKLFGTGRSRVCVIDHLSTGQNVRTIENWVNFWKSEFNCFGWRRLKTTNDDNRQAVMHNVEAAGVGCAAGY